MTLSDKRLEANRKNAIKGGVKTPEGKAVTRFNALKHGLLCRDILIWTEKPSELQKLANSLLEDLRPANVMERILTEKIIADLWRLRRALIIERELMEDKWITVDSSGNLRKRSLSDSIGYDLLNYDNYGKFIRYLTSIERGIYRALHELQRLQAQRTGEKVVPPMVLDVDISSKG